MLATSELNIIYWQRYGDHLRSGSPALHAVNTAEVNEGDDAVFGGLGPIGLPAAHWCKLRGAIQGVGVDIRSERLKFAPDHMKLEVVNRDDLSSAPVVAKLQHMQPSARAEAVSDATGSSTSSGFLRSEKTRDGGGID
ncbi:hypothetical protein PsorP6_010952 [Peronosclerospora sorghi]|uniref:Uncharacterized protein n=1 Tax=Peronosclerospora sorghi TaxID=230839 RepID=A0ACC0VYQ6_9STRA|nr:hypothetical protein PsorP6_010952 [Peronosclerospora sorghi]